MRSIPLGRILAEHFIEFVQNIGTRPCFIEWLKGMQGGPFPCSHFLQRALKKTQFSNKAYLSNGARFPVLNGRTIMEVIWRGGGGVGQENTKIKIHGREGD